MRIVSASLIEDAVARLYVRANVRLPEDLRRAMKNAAQTEPYAPAAGLLRILDENAELAESRNIPVCQDTGIACVFLDVGGGVYIEGDVNEAVNNGVRRAGRDGLLRASVVSDPLRRVNTGDNTPAALYVEFVPGNTVTVTVAPKGFGSENMSGIKMLKPSDGEGGVVDFVTDIMRNAGGNPCPPVILGVGLGGTFDKAAYLAKRALLRGIGEANPDPYYAGLERRILDGVNALGVGPQGFGGRTTALAVSILSAPTHIAGLPAAVNVSCHVTRHATEVI